MGRGAVSPHGGDCPHHSHVASNETRVAGRNSATIRALKTTFPPGGFPLGEKVDDRHRFFESEAHAPHTLVHLTAVKPIGQLEGVLIRVVAPPAGPQAQRAVDGALVPLANLPNEFLARVFLPLGQQASLGTQRS